MRHNSRIQRKIREAVVKAMVEIEAEAEGEVVEGDQVGVTVAIIT